MKRRNLLLLGFQQGVLLETLTWQGHKSVAVEAHL